MYTVLCFKKSLRLKLAFHLGVDPRSPRILQQQQQQQLGESAPRIAIHFEKFRQQKAYS